MPYEPTPKHPPLLRYYVSVTAGCNLRCWHCSVAPPYDADGSSGVHLDPDLLETAIDDALPLGLSNLRLTGGEPTLHPRLLDILALVTSRGLTCSLETNAILIDEDYARQMKDRSGLNMVSVSLDAASAAIHDAQRGVQGSFDKAVQGIRHLVSAGIHPQVIMSVTKDNASDIEPVVGLAQALGCSSVKINLVKRTGRKNADSARDRMLPIEELIRLGRWVRGELQPRIPIPVFYDWPRAFQSFAEINRAPKCSCGIYNTLGILADGQIAMCALATRDSKLRYGMLGRDRVPEVWANHPALLEIRETIPWSLEGVCGRCLLRSHCLGRCVADNYFGTGRFTGSHWFCQRAYDMGLFPQSRLR